MARTGRPKINIDKQKFEYLCSIMATLEEIAGLFQCSKETIERWCKRTYKDEHGNPLTFADTYKRYATPGKISLRRVQWESAKRGNVTMQIFLGKQWLGQTDRIETASNVSVSDNFLQALNASAAADWQQEDNDDTSTDV